MIDFFCVGVPKTGTTSLYEALIQTGRVFDAPLKEPHYLVYPNQEFVLRPGGHPMYMDTWTATREAYFQNYDANNSALLTADFSTHYFRYIQRFKENGEALFGDSFTEIPIILILRHPVKRAFSHYAMKTRDGSETLSFIEAVKAIPERMTQGYIPSFDYIGFSEYRDSYAYLIKHFKKVLILNQSDLHTNFENVMHQIADFLGLDLPPVDNPPVLNRSGKPNDNGVARLMHGLVFKDNALKRMLPDGFKRAMANSVKGKVFDAFMSPIKMTPEEEAFASNLLEKEIAFFNQLFPPKE